MLERTLPEKSAGLCGMIAISRRSSDRPRRRVSIPSIEIGASPSPPSLVSPPSPPSPSSLPLPPALAAASADRGSTRRSSASSRLDLPEPVRPTMPTRWPPWMLAVSPLSTSGVLAR
eukprot:scaffold57074_cov61-Phaeocystis_antarctica.AAC.3